MRNALGSLLIITFASGIFIPADIYAAEISGFRDRQRLVSNYILDGQSVVSAQAPEWFSACKTKTSTPDKLGFPLTFQQDTYNGQIQITNPSRRHVAQITIEYQKTLSSIRQTYLRVASIKPNSSVVFDSWMDLRLMTKDRVVGVKGFAPTKIECTEKFTAEEIENQEKEQLAEEAERRALAQKRREFELKREIIFDNCMADKLPVTNNRQLNNTVRKICDRIADKPNWWHRFRYAD